MAHGAGAIMHRANTQHIRVLLLPRDKLVTKVMLLHKPAKLIATCLMQLAVS